MTAKPETAAEVLAEMRKWGDTDGCFNDNPEGHPEPTVYYTKEAWVALCDRLERALSAQGEAVAWEVQGRDGVWTACTRELYERTLASGRYNGYENGPKCEVRALYTHPTPAAKPITRENEASLMLAIAEFIAASATPEDPRLAVADAISRHLGLGWPSASHPAPARVTEEMEPRVATGPYVDRIIRIFSKCSRDDTTDLVLKDYARAAIAAALEDGRHG